MFTFCTGKQLNICIHCTTSADFVQNVFLKRPFSAKSTDLYCLFYVCTVRSVMRELILFDL